MAGSSKQGESYYTPFKALEGCMQLRPAGKPVRRAYIGWMNTTTLSSGPSIQRSRGVERVVRGQPTSDGDGVKLTRVLTQPLQKRLDPFLMLDAFGSGAPGG